MRKIVISVSEREWREIAAYTLSASPADLEAMEAAGRLGVLRWIRGADAPWLRDFLTRPTASDGA